MWPEDTDRNVSGIWIVHFLKLSENWPHSQITKVQFILYRTMHPTNGHVLTQSQDTPR